MSEGKKRSRAKAANPDPGPLEVIWVAPAQLVADPDNAMTHPERNKAAVRASVDRFGWVEPLVVWNGTVLGGNCRLEVAHERGDKLVPTVRVDHLDERQARALAIALNQSGRTAEWDWQKLAGQLRQLTEQADDDLVSVLGFQEHEIEPLLAAQWTPPQVDLDQEPPPPNEHTGGGPAAKRSLDFTPDQWAAVSAAVANSETPSDPAQAVAQICRQWVAGGRQGQ